MRLLETYLIYSSRDEITPSVDFTNIIAVESLRKPEIWRNITLYTSEVNFSPALSLYRPCLHMYKKQAPEQITNPYSKV